MISTRERIDPRTFAQRFEDLDNKRDLFVEIMLQDGYCSIIPDVRIEAILAVRRLVFTDILEALRLRWFISRTTSMIPATSDEY